MPLVGSPEAHEAKSKLATKREVGRMRPLVNKDKLRAGMKKIKRMVHRMNPSLRQKLILGQVQATHSQAVRLDSAKPD